MFKSQDCVSVGETSNLQEKRVIINRLVLMTLLCSIGYVACSFCLPILKITLMNIFIFEIAILCLFVAGCSIIRYGLKNYNVFASIYFAFLAINCINISNLQKSKTVIDLYYLFFGAILFISILYCFEQKIQIRSFARKKNIVSAEKLACCFFCIVLILKTIIIMRNGIKLLDNNWDTSNNYTLGGISGLSDMLQLLLLMLFPIITKKWRYIIPIFIILVNGILFLERNFVIVVIIYLILYAAYSRGELFIIDKKTKKYIKLSIFLLIVIFALWGNYRQQQRGWETPETSLKICLQSNVDNSITNWLYAYTSINFDVLVQCMPVYSHSYTLNSVCGPLNRLILGNKRFSDMNNVIPDGLNGFNMSTIFGEMVRDFGELYIIPVFLLGLQVGIMLLFARWERAKGYYVYLITLGALSICSNFYNKPLYYFTSIAAGILFLYIRETS